MNDPPGGLREKMPELEQLAGLHNPYSENPDMAAMSIAYCDESEYPKLPGAVFVVSGFLGNSMEWFELGRKWTLALRKEGLEATGFHMADCENRQRGTPYYDMERDQRDHLQRTFIDLINAAEIWGMAAAIELARYREHKETFKKHLGPFHKPYYMVFQHCVGWMTEQMDQGGFPSGERIAFVFDSTKEHEGLAKELYGGLLDEEDGAPFPGRHRLGTLAFENDVKVVQLQAADVWAYEVQKHIRETKIEDRPVRWQFERLHDIPNTHQRRIQVMTPEGLDGFMKEAGWL